MAYNFDDIKDRADCRVIAQVLGLELSRNHRCAATWRGGDNPDTVAISETGFYDHKIKGGGSVIDLVALVKFSGDLQQAAEWLGEYLNLQPSVRKKTVAWREVATYTYTDVAGTPLHYVTRSEHPEKGKRFRQKAADGKNTVKHIEQVLYNLPAVTASQQVILVEGEKDANSLIDLDLPATTNVGGSGKWKDSYTTTLTSKAVVIIGDNDEAGKIHMDTVGKALTGQASEVRHLTISQLEKGDVTDWLQKEGGTKDKLLEAIANAPIWEPTEQPEPERALSVFYDQNRKEYQIKNGVGHWFAVGPSPLKRRLKKHGLSQDEINDFLTETEDFHYVEYVGELAGYPAGHCQINETQVLITKGPRIIQAAQGEWPLIDGILEALFADDEHGQREYFIAWLKIARLGLTARKNAPGQCIILAGPAECGKTLLQEIITQCLGGRTARPYQYMAGKTEFNSDLFSAEHLIMEDESPHTDIKSRRSFGQRIKELTVNLDQRCHKKGREGLTLKPFWRLSLSMNDETENLMILPPLDQSIVDKIMLLKCEKNPLPIDSRTPEKRAASWEAIMAELPAFLDHVESFEIPEHMQDARMGVNSFLHPVLVEEVRRLDPEHHLLELIDIHLWKTEPDDYWTGTARELEKLLAEVVTGITWKSNLLAWRQACGTYLSRLCNSKPDRVEKLSISHGIQKYLITKEVK